MIFVSHDDKTATISIGNINNATRRGMLRGWRDVGSRLVLELRKQTLEKPKAGRLYRIGGRIHRASKAGETPAARTRNYTRKSTYRASSSQLVFGNDAAYAKYLEDGTKKMAARQGLKNAIDAQENELQSILRQAICRELQK